MIVWRSLEGLSEDVLVEILMNLVTHPLGQLLADIIQILLESPLEHLLNDIWMLLLGVVRIRMRRKAQPTTDEIADHARGGYVYRHGATMINEISCHSCRLFRYSGGV